MFPMDIFHGMGLGRPFDVALRCYSMSMHPADKQSLDDGDKIILPPTALDVLSRLNISYPMMFKLTNTKNVNALTHCGVMEFVAEEGKVFIPYWMMKNLLIDQGDTLKIQYVQLPKGTYAKFEAQSPDFLDITNPKAVLENALRNFTCLTKDQIICINYNDKLYEMRVCEVKPANAVTITEVDLIVDFEKPVGYTEPTNESDPPSNSEVSSVASLSSDETQRMLLDACKQEAFLPYSGTGARLDGKKKNTETPLRELAKNVMTKRGIPDYNYKPGYLRFNRNFSTPSATPAPSEDVASAPPPQFSGQGFSLRAKKKGTN